MRIETNSIKKQSSKKKSNDYKTKSSLWNNNRLQKHVKD